MKDNNYIARLHNEYGELDLKINKLKNFILSDKYDELQEVDRKDLKEQLNHMTGYIEVLGRRLSRSCRNA